MKKNILITGATGLIGSRLVRELSGQGAVISILSTNPERSEILFQNLKNVNTYRSSIYSDPQKLCEIVEDTDVIVNLAGANVSAKRWTEDYKKIIYDSRIITTKLIADAIKLSGNKPECFISASGVGVYGFCNDEKITEDSKTGDDFLAKVCKDWEDEAMKATQYGVRVVTVRTGIVLDHSDGALKEFLVPFKFQFGAYQGSGKQWLSWIHIKDIIELYIFAVQNKVLNGCINGTSPEPVTNKEFTKAIANTLNIKLVLPVPEFALKLLLGEFAKNLTEGQRVYPEKALKEGFKFNYPELKNALQNLLYR